MIKLLTEEKTEEFKSFCKDKYSAAVINTRLLTYGTNDSCTMFWYNESENGQITAVLSMTDSVLTVCCDEQIDSEELTLFAQTVGAKEISHQSAKYILVFEKNEKSPDALKVTGENVSDLFDVIFEQDEKRNEYFSLWYTDISHKIRHGLIHGFCIYEDGKCVSTALTSGETDKIAVISGVSTLSRYRRKGYAERAVVSLAKSLKKDVYLMTNDRKLCDWYIKTGFRLL